MDFDRTSRRDLLRLATVAGAGLAARESEAQQRPGKSVSGMPFVKKDTVRIGLIGTGGRGNSHIDNFGAAPGVSFAALCDVVKEKAQRAQARVERMGRQNYSAAIYDAGDHAYEDLVKREDIDLVVIATPWDWHVPMAIAAMKANKHVAVEVPAAMTIEECWDLVNTSEATQRHCIMLENCNYGYNELLVLNMVKAGMFGELTHGAAAYNHDLRSVLFSDRGEGLWRRLPHLTHNGNLYPTHGLGPVANYMDINRGDRFEYLVSMSSIPASLAAYRKDHVPGGDPKWREVYKEGDLNISLIHTAKGRVITLEHNTSSPQPYDRINLIAGTKGIFRDYPPRIYIDGQGKADQFGPLDPYKPRFEHAWWKETGELARKLGGHGGMDFVMAYRLVRAIRDGTAPDMDVYDAAALSAPGPLSEQSVAKGSAPVPFPDFTRGRWQKRA